MNFTKFSLITLALLMPQISNAQNSPPQNIVKTINGPSDTPNFSALEPYWAHKPVVEILGRSKIEFESNNAVLRFTVSEIDKDQDKALLKVSQRAQPAIDKVVAILGKDGRIDVNYIRRAIYQQYKDKDGNKIENEREDRVENYVIGWSIIVETKNMSLVPKIRAEILAVENSMMTDRVDYSFSPSPAQERQLFSAAIEDGKERAKIVSDAYGVKLKLLMTQEGRSECLSSPSGYGEKSTENKKTYLGDNANVVVTGSRIKPIQTDLIMPAAPETHELKALVCMVYAVEK